ncbi:MAG: hypothetical protein ACXACI_13185 [Candidatus Hodarchaeales archaeon]|jgi:hypothetical protein
MPISYRHYQNPNDLALQTELWLQATQHLPWAWKPNKTQVWYTQQATFDPKSKLFALDGEKSIGYTSCIRRETFTPLGFPWVLDGYEGEIQDVLFTTIYDYAVKQFHSKSFLQRFRKEWGYHIKFFERYGFELAWSNPIYSRELKKTPLDIEFVTYRAKLHQIMPVNALFAIIKNDPSLQNEDRKSLKEYFTVDLDLDWVLEVQDHHSKPIGMSVITSREDTGYAELSLLTANQTIPHALNLTLELTINELISRNQKFLSVTVKEGSPKIDFFKSYEFKLRSESVFYSKESK